MWTWEHKYSQSLKPVRPRKTAIREMWTDLGEGLVGKLLRGYRSCLGHLLLGKFLRCLAALSVQRCQSKKRWHTTIDAVKK